VITETDLVVLVPIPVSFDEGISLCVSEGVHYTWFLLKSQ